MKWWYKGRLITYKWNTLGHTECDDENCIQCRYIRLIPLPKCTQAVLFAYLHSNSLLHIHPISQRLWGPQVTFPAFSSLLSSIFLIPLAKSLASWICSWVDRYPFSLFAWEFHKRPVKESLSKQYPRTLEAKLSKPWKNIFKIIVIISANDYIHESQLT